MIIGIGSDIVNITRIEQLLSHHGDKLISKILHISEIAIYTQLKLKKQKIHFLAKRFAAKEALVKAIGTGFDDNFTLTNIHITNNQAGKPEIFCESLPQNIQIHLTISDDHPFAFASVVIEKLST